MALPGSLNRYLLLMAQEHLEFRLPVSRPGVPGAEARTPHAPARGGVSAGCCARLDRAGVRPLSAPSPGQPFSGTMPCHPALHVRLTPQ